MGPFWRLRQSRDAPPANGQACPDKHTAKTSTGAQGDLPQPLPHKEAGSAKPLKDVPPFSPSIQAALLLCRGFCGLLLFLPSSPTTAPLKKKCQDKQNESLGDPVMGTERECGNHSSDLCSDMFSVCFHTECTFSPWISNNLNQGEIITKWPSNTMSLLELND